MAYSAPSGGGCLPGDHVVACADHARTMIAKWLQSLARSILWVVFRRVQRETMLADTGGRVSAMAFTASLLHICSVSSHHAFTGTQVLSVRIDRRCTDGASRGIDLLHDRRFSSPGGKAGRWVLHDFMYYLVLRKLCT